MTFHQDIIIQADNSLDVAAADNAAIEELKEVASAYSAAEHDGERLRLHLVLRNQSLADTLKQMTLESPLAENIELYAYTREELWALEMLGVRPESLTRLDRTPLTKESEAVVHLVLFGATAQAESLAVFTALTAHYPNQCRNSRLRTRITMVSDATEDFRHFQQLRRNLLLHSHRREVIIRENKVDTHVELPLYTGIRKDFVDIEWEFVEGKSDSNVLSYKLQKWAEDPQQQLTLAFCYDADERNITETLALPRGVLESVPVWTKVRHDRSLQFLKQSPRFARIFPFGMEDTQLKSIADFIRMAQCVNYAYNQIKLTLQEGKAGSKLKIDVPIEVPSATELQRLWNNPRLTTSKRWSNIYNALTLRTKMHSLGYAAEDWNTLFGITETEVEALSKVEHNRWSVEELILGYIPTTEEEHKEIKKNLSLRRDYKAKFKHDDLRHHSELGVDEGNVPVVAYDIGIIRSLPLIAYAYQQLKGKQSVEFLGS